MKEYIQKNGDEVSIVIYDAPLPPKYFRLTKRFIKTLFVVVPILSVSILFLVFTWGIGSRLKDAPTSVITDSVYSPEDRTTALEAEIKSLQESNKQLAEKLSITPASTGDSDNSFLMIIKKPYGMQSLISENKVSLDQFEFLHEKNKINLKFQIISSNPETKVLGHIIVFMISDSGLLAYPQELNSNLLDGIKYSSGEPFAVSRLRPTNAEFKYQPNGNEVKFVIYIFSREGDLLLVKQTENFKLGQK